MQRFTLVLLILLGACGNDSAPPDPPATAPVYYGQVQRIINDNCVECHSADPDRLAPFSLATYEDAVAAAQDTPMAFAVMTREMPPYYANQDGACHKFPSAKWLSSEDQATLASWIDGTRAEGDPANTVALPPPLPELAHVDHQLDIGTPYTPDTSVTDDYRCFVVDPIGLDKFVTGVHVRPGNLTAVHHVIVFTLPSQQAEDDVVARTQAAGGAYRCDGGPTELGATFLTGWAPGNQAVLFPTGTGIAVSGARKLVVQIHYNLANSDGQPDHTTIDLQLDSTVASQAQILAVRGDVDLPPHDPDAQATGTRQLPSIVPTGRLWGAAIHMHGRGTGAQVVSASSQDACLIDLDGWSFHWQHFYWYDAPVEVHGGDTLRVTCHYDTSNDTGRVVWGESTSDEMCLAYLYVSL